MVGMVYGCRYWDLLERWEAVDFEHSSLRTVAAVLVVPQVLLFPLLLRSDPVEAFPAEQPSRMLVEFESAAKQVPSMS